MALQTSQKAKEIMNALHHRDHIDDMTKKWLSLTSNPPQISVFYTLTKIHKPNAVGRPIRLAQLNESHRLLITYISPLLNTKIVSQRYYIFLKFYRENESRKRHNPCLKGRY